MGILRQLAQGAQSRPLKPALLIARSVVLAESVSRAVGAYRFVNGHEESLGT